MMPELKKTIIALRISSVIYFIIGVVFTPLVVLIMLSEETPLILAITMGLVTLISSVGIGVFIEVVISNLKKEKHWAWLAGVIICGIYLPSGFLVLGAVGLWGLLDDKVRSQFDNKKSEV
ncbi:hypothetical protein KKC60_02265 [Patescibacteria group bacterium]|nr:hypothetical protein [Patescibacteria group bacterium]